MTEDEAKEKWCPFGRTPHFARDLDFRAVVAANRASQTFEQDALGIPEQPLPTCFCIGSACMAWRWDEPWTSKTEEGQGGDLVLRLKRKPGEPKLGGCGLAGAPQ